MKLLFISLLTLVLLSAGRPLSAAAETAAAPVAQTQGVQCLRQETPPPPPDGGAVIAGPLDPNNSEPNVIVIQGYSDSSTGWQAGQCGPNAFAIMRQPTSIAVASPANNNSVYGAVFFNDSDSGCWIIHNCWGSAWGAVSANAASSPLVLFPGKPDFTPDRVGVWWGEDPPGSDNHPSLADFVQDNQSCRGCVLTGREIPLMVDPLSTLSNMAWAGNFSGADLLDATLFAIDRSTGGSPTNEPLSLIGWDFSGANLSNVTGLKGANLSGANLSGCQPDQYQLARRNPDGHQPERRHLDQ